MGRQLAAAVPRVETPPFLAARLAAVARGGAAPRAGHSRRALRLAGFTALAALSVWLIVPPQRPPVKPATPPANLAALMDATLAEPARLAGDPRLTAVTQVLDQPLQQEFKRLLADAGNAWRSLAADFSPSPIGP
jgi:hypothetical protein